MAVQIEKPANMALAAWFTELRSWFDINKCQPVSFLPNEGVIDKVAFNVTFSENTHARLFASKFTIYASSIRHVISSERNEILLNENWGNPISDERADFGEEKITSS